MLCLCATCDRLGAAVSASCSSCLPLTERIWNTVARELRHEPAPRAQPARAPLDYNIPRAHIITVCGSFSCKRSQHACQCHTDTRARSLLSLGHHRGPWAVHMRHAGSPSRHVAYENYHCGCETRLHTRRLSTATQTHVRIEDVKET